FGSQRQFVFQRALRVGSSAVPHDLHPEWPRAPSDCRHGPRRRPFMSRFRLIWRKSLNGLMLTLTGVAAFAVVAVLFFILGYFIYNGGKSLNWDFFTKLPKPVGETGGGMANGVLGSRKPLVVASLIGIPGGTVAGVYLSEYPRKKFATLVRFTADVLNGVPSIVIG